MQGTSLTKQERECKLYDAFDKFAHVKRESLHQYYLIFTQLINDMNIYKMRLEQFQANTKFLNSLPSERSKFVMDVKLVRDLHTTNFDRLHAYLQQHELHANKVRIIHLGVEKGLDTQTVITHNAAYQTDDLDAYDFDCYEISTFKAVLIANLSSYGSDVLSEDKNAQFADFEKEINSLKQTLSEQLKEKELLITTFNVFKNESKEKEAKNIDKEIALEKS
nr:hypothetical protein [Tanacetum cinerariifolium]